MAESVLLKFCASVFGDMPHPDQTQAQDIRAISWEVTLIYTTTKFYIIRNLSFIFPNPQTVRPFT